MIYLSLALGTWPVREDIHQPAGLMDDAARALSSSAASSAIALTWLITLKSFHYPPAADDDNTSMGSALNRTPPPHHSCLSVQPMYYICIYIYISHAGSSGGRERSVSLSLSLSPAPLLLLLLHLLSFSRTLPIRELHRCTRDLYFYYSGRVTVWIKEREKERERERVSPDDGDGTTRRDIYISRGEPAVSTARASSAYVDQRRQTAGSSAISCRARANREYMRLCDCVDSRAPSPRLAISLSLALALVTSTAPRVERDFR